MVALTGGPVLDCRGGHWMRVAASLAQMMSAFSLLYAIVILV
jgi:hypothetical protein